MCRSGWLCLETDPDALRHNMGRFRALVPADVRLLAVVKADAYGHGLSVASRAFLAGGADVLGVHMVEEAAALRDDGIEAPILVLGPSIREDAARAAHLDVALTVGSLSALESLAAVATADHPLRLHLKVETGVNRQGLVESELDASLALLDAVPGLDLVGLSSHFADVEDTQDRSVAQAQIDRFEAWRRRLTERGRGDLVCHMSCSASTLVLPGARWDMVRVGVAAYGVWPSRVTRVAAREAGHGDLDLRPAVAWRCGVAQVREVPRGGCVGYGGDWEAPVDSRIAVLPVGYSDGYPRRLSDRAHVLIRGRRAPVRGRVCMNLTMVDVTHIPEVRAGDTAVLLGAQGEERVSVEQLAGWLDTIPYEVLTLPGSTWRRSVIDEAARI